LAFRPARAILRPPTFPYGNYTETKRAGARGDRHVGEKADIPAQLGDNGGIVEELEQVPSSHAIVMLVIAGTIL
jgi:hypothetical protein